MKTKRAEIIVLAVLILLQSALFAVFGINKTYIHMDEAYSFAIAGNEIYEIHDQKDFFNNWHDASYYEKYLSLEKEGNPSVLKIFENSDERDQPPLYFLLLRVAMLLSKGGFATWPALMINAVIYVFTTLLSYLILKRIFRAQPHCNEKSAIVAFLASVTMASITGAIYVMSYALAAFNIILLFYLHVRLIEEKKSKLKWYIFIGVAVFIGVLTNYDYLFFLAILFGCRIYRYLRKADFRSIAFYMLSVIVALGLAMLAFPSALNDVISGYWFHGFAEKLNDKRQIVLNFASFSWELNTYGFNLFLSIIGIFAGFVAYYRKCRPDRIRDVFMPDEETDDILKSLCLSTIGYFIIVSVSAYWIELRYILPICIPLFMIVFYYFQRLLAAVFGENRGDVLVCAAFVIMFILLPYTKKLTPPVLYADKADIVKQVETELNVPTVYFLNSQNDRFLDDILLFTKLDNSYIAKDAEVSVDGVKAILDGKDVSKGVTVFVNSGNDNEAIVEAVKTATGLKRFEHIKRLNDCDVYYISK